MSTFRNYGFFAVFSVLLTACSGDVAEQVEIVRPVKYTSVESVSGDRVLNITGIIRAEEQAELSFRVGGTVIRLEVAPGQKISKGQLLAELDNADAKLKLDKQSLSLGKAKVQMDNARSNLDRVKGLYENNNVPLGDYESAKEKYSNARASYETEKRALDLMGREYSYYQLRSTVSGVVLSKMISLNENVQSGQVIAVIQSGDGLSVEVGMPEQYVAQIKDGLETSIFLPSIENRAFQGLVTEVAYTVSADSSTYPVQITFTNPDTSIRPGMPATVEFKLGLNDGSRVLVVPAHSVIKDGPEHFVFVAVDSGAGTGVVNKVLVKVGRLTDKGFEVFEGVNEGDKVVVAGISSLEDGMKVRLLK